MPMSLDRALALGAGLVLLAGTLPPAARPAQAQAVAVTPAAAPSAAGPAVVQPPPVAVARTLDVLRERLRRAEAALLNKDKTGALAMMQEVEAGLASLRETRGREVTQGNVAAFVLEERIAVMKRQLAPAPAAPAMDAATPR